MIKELAALILAWFAAQPGATWWECGHQYTKQEAQVRAEQIATWVTRYTHLDAPEGRKWTLALIAAESGFDSCQVGGWFRKKAGLSLSPKRERVIDAIVHAKGRAIDSGLGQFLVVPGSRESAEKALDPEHAIRRLGSKLPEHYRYCQYKHPNGIVVREGVKLECDEAYWVFHNQSSFNVKYYRNVRKQAERMGW